MNLKDFSVTKQSPPPSNSDAKSLLGQTTNLRLNQFQVNKGTWNPPPDLKQPMPVTSSDSGSFGKNFGSAIKDEVVGAAKGAASDSAGLGGLVAKGLSYLPGQLGKFFKGGDQIAGDVQKGLEPKTGAEQFGSALSTAGQLATGVDALTDLGVKGVTKLFDNKTADSVMSYITKEGEKVFTRLTPEELDSVKDEVKNIPGAKTGSSQIHLDATEGKSMDRFGTELNRDEFIKGHPQASEVFDNINKSGPNKKVIDAVSPKLTAKETEQALAEGRGQGGGLLSKTKIKPDARTLEVADSVKGIINPSASGAENINKVRTALSKEAEGLKSQIESVDHAYSYKELNSKFEDIKPPISIRGTAFEKQIDAVKDAALDIAKKNGGKVSSLLDSRKEFDVLVSKEYPNLYDRENAPMRNAITAIRNTMNDFIQENLPSNVSFKDSLKKQSLYYDAIDNIAGNSTEDVNKTGIQKKVGGFVKKHPVVSTAIGGAVTGGLYETTKDIAKDVTGL